MFRRQIVEAIGGLIGKVVKLDFKTDRRTRGRFARLAVFINLSQPLVSQVLVDGAIQWVEYEGLPTVCFGCGKYGYVKDLCPSVDLTHISRELLETTREALDSGGRGTVVESRLEFAPWMLVERRSRRGQRVDRSNTGGNNGADDSAKSQKEIGNTRFTALRGLREMCENLAGELVSVEESGIDSNVKDGGPIIRRVGSRLMSEPTTKASIGNGQSSSIKIGIINGSGAGLSSSGPGKELDTTSKSGQTVLEKRPMMDKPINHNIHEQAGSNNDIVFEDVNRGNFSNEIRRVLNNGNLDNIVAHVNPAFEDFGGTNISISEDVLDPGKHSAITFKDSTHKKEKGKPVNSTRGILDVGVSRSREKSGGKDLIERNGRKASSALRGRGSRFKSSGNSRVPLADSMEEMAKFMSNSKLSKESTSGLEDGTLVKDGNTSLRLDTGNASAGAVARDMNGQWLFGFNKFLGKCSIFDAELWGIFEGFKIIQRRGHDRVIILSDSLDVIRGIQGSNFVTSNSALIRHIQSMLSQESSWCLHYIPREQNEVADCMAKEALSTRTDLQFLDTPSLRVQSMLDLDQSKGFLQYVGCN
ncbi:hypothetical protein J1N35_043300 [Gossypium stocksii]|uniref:RNase H type-1 domain-containing protein n=1 Tax=Gossypium stocksii TaxID=47602 RepID=A0A9D3U776_9ROSI|nr:hypothetical protein J1N35_043300 [Gossypium stocksii]